MCLSRATPPVSLSFSEPLETPTGPASRAGGVWPKLLHPFIHFLCLLSSYRPFHLYLFLKNSSHHASVSSSFGAADFCLNDLAFSCICLHSNSSFYNSSLSLRSSSDPVRLPCAARRVGGGWVAVCRMQHVSLARTSPRRVAGLAPHGAVRGQS